MKTIHICAIHEVSKTIEKHGITHVLSILEPGERPNFPKSFNKQNWRLVIADDVIDAKARNACTEEQVKDTLDWVRALPKDAVLLVHCVAGISRSTAFAAAILVEHYRDVWRSYDPHKDGTDYYSPVDVDAIDFGDQAIGHVTDIRPQACPNGLIIAHADKLLGLNGHLIEANERWISRWLIKKLHE